MKEPRRILHVVTDMGFGGISSFIMQLYRHIDRDQFQFDFLVHRQGESRFENEIIQLGGRIYRVPSLAYSHYFQYLRASHAFFTQHSYSVVHAHNNAFSAFPLKVAKHCGVPTRIAHSHNTSSDRGPIGNLAVRYCRATINAYCTHRLACSTEAGDWLFGKKNAHEVRIIPNAIDTSAYVFDLSRRRAIRSLLGLQDRFVVGHVGSFLPQKNHMFLVDTFSELHSAYPNSALLLIGDGPLLPVVQAEVVRRHLTDSVIFAGLQSAPEDFYQAMDVFCLPSKYEGLPVVLIEAQASGLKTLVADAVSREVRITSDLSFASIDLGPAIWAQMLLQSASGYDRLDRRLDIVYAGFDAQKNAESMAALYDDAWRDVRTTRLLPTSRIASQ